MHITDHYPILTVFCNARNRPQVIEFRDHSDGCVKRLKNEAGVVFSFLSDSFDYNVDDCAKFFIDTFYSLYNSCCPLRRKNLSINKLSKPWLTESLKISINRKHALFRDFKRGLLSFEAYKSYRNRLSGFLKQAKVQYFHNKFRTTKNNPKLTWNSINSLLNKTKTKIKPAVEDFNDRFRTVLDLTNGFNEQFSTIASRLSSAQPSNNTDPLEHMNARNPSSFFILPTDANEIARIIDSLPNKSSSPDQVPTFIYKILKYEISPILNCLFNLSVREGKFPDSLKVARVIPVFKSGDKSCFFPIIDLYQC